MGKVQIDTYLTVKFFDDTDKYGLIWKTHI